MSKCSLCNVALIMKCRVTSCYLTADERRAVEEIAAKEERARTKIIQFAVRDFIERYRQGVVGKFRESAPTPSR